MGASRQRRAQWCARIVVVAAISLLGIFDIPSSSVVASVQISDSDPTQRIAAGQSHTCAINNDHTVWCWGDNSLKQLGSGVSVSTGNSTTPVQTAALPSGRIPSTIAAGLSHTCLLATDGSVWCWGANGSGALGDGTTFGKAAPTQVSLPATATSIAAGGYETCAVLSTQSLYCWGKNSNGQVGNGQSPADETSPQLVGQIPSSFVVSQLDIGDVHVCAVSTAGAVWCWGNYLNGRLGSTAQSDALLPTATSSLNGTAIMVSAGKAHTCVVLSGGALRCFGSNGQGQIGQALTTTSNSSTNEILLSNTQRVSSGGEFTCVLLTSGNVQCFGKDNVGQLASGAISSPRVTPGDVTNLGGTAVDVVAGSNHACAVLATGVVKCWGKNDLGQVGSNPPNDPEVQAVAVGSLNVVPTTTSSSSSSSSSSSIAAGSSTPSSSTEGTNSTPINTNANASLLTSSTASYTSDASSTTVKTFVNYATIAPRITRLSIRRGASVSAAKIAAAVSMAVPKTSKGSMRISIVSGNTRCRFRGSTVVGVRVGSCAIAVTLMPKRGKNITRRTTIVVR